MSPQTSKPLIYLISDGSINDLNYGTTSSAFLRLLATATETDVSFVQLREKQLSTRLLFELACRASSVTKGSRTKLLINDRMDVALAAGADGVHLTADSIRTAAVRAAAPPGFVIGVSAHSIDDVRRAAESGADFAVFGPIFDSPRKGTAVGLSALGGAVDMSNDMPVLALGGVDDTNYRDVLTTGAAGFAAIRFLNDQRVLERLQSEFGQ